jgi:hypothetical protein
MSLPQIEASGPLQHLMFALGCQGRTTKFSTEKHPIRDETAIFISGETAIKLGLGVFLERSYQ